jgi:hypothetical protein
MKNDKSSPQQEKEWQDSLLEEGRIDENTQSPFEQARQKLAESPLQDEADAEQQHKEAMTERD